MIRTTYVVDILTLHFVLTLANSASLLASTTLKSGFLTDLSHFSNIVIFLMKLSLIKYTFIH